MPFLSGELGENGEVDQSGVLDPLLLHTLVKYIPCGDVARSILEEHLGHLAHLWSGDEWVDHVSSDHGPRSSSCPNVVVAYTS